jgi:hypothetical protein
MITTFSGAIAQSFCLEHVFKMTSSEETVSQASSALGPCQSKPHGLLPSGMMTQLRSWRGMASTQKCCLNMSTPAPSVDSKGI